MCLPRIISFLSFKLWILVFFRHTPVHLGRSTPTGYYDYAIPHYGGTYGYNYHYAQYYPGYPGGYGYYYPDYTEYSGYGSSQDQSYISGQEQYPGTGSKHTDWSEQQGTHHECILPFPCGVAKYRLARTAR